MRSRWTPSKPGHNSFLQCSKVQSEPVVIRRLGIWEPFLSERVPSRLPLVGLFQCDLYLRFDAGLKFGKRRWRFVGRWWRRRWWGRLVGLS